MQKAPEMIIAEFESRRNEERSARKGKTKRRTFDVAQIVVAVAVTTVVLSRIVSDMTIGAFLFTTFVVFGYLSRELRKRWAIEDRLDALETKKA